MSDDLGVAIVIILGTVVPMSVLLYGTYWALSFRRALIGRIYRSHALWLGVICVLLMFNAFFNSSSNAIISEVGAPVLFLIFPILFAFIDSSVRVARRSDPLLRSNLRWEKLRQVIWADIAALEALIVLSTFSSAGNSDLANILWVIFASFPFITGGPALLIAARRSGDLVLRGSLKWIGVTLLFGILSVVVSSILSSIPSISTFDYYYSYPALILGAIRIGTAYSLYRSARSLAPISRIPAIEPAMTGVLSAAQSPPPVMPS